MNIIAQRHLALFHQLHERDGGERLGHRRDAVDRVFRQGLAFARIALQRLIGRAVLQPDQNARMRQLAGVEIFFLQERRDAFETALVEAIAHALAPAR